MQQENLLPCSICSIPIASEDIFQNSKYCKHQFCIYCLQEIKESIRKFHSCFLKVCNQRLDTYRLTKFLDSYKKKQSQPSQPLQNNVQNNKVNQSNLSDYNQPMDQHIANPVQVSQNYSDDAKRQKELDKQDELSQNQECSICKISIESVKVFINNPFCNHKYCYYCLSDVSESLQKYQACLLKNCLGKLNKNELQQFLNSQNDDSEEKSGILQLDFSSDLSDDNQVAQSNQDSNQSEIQCSICRMMISSELVYSNTQYCGHRFCAYCLEELKNFHLIEGCIMRNCPGNLDKDGVSSFLGKRNKQESITSKCLICTQVCSLDKLIQNAECSHIFCVLCVKNTMGKYKDYCPVEKCCKKLTKEILEQIQSMEKKSTNSNWVTEKDYDQLLNDPKYPIH